jgi:hypothetical protein
MVSKACVFLLAGLVALLGSLTSVSMCVACAQCCESHQAVAMEVMSVGCGSL